MAKANLRDYVAWRLHLPAPASREALDAVACAPKGDGRISGDFFHADPPNLWQARAAPRRPLGVHALLHWENEFNISAINNYPMNYI